MNVRDLTEAPGNSRRGSIAGRRVDGQESDALASFAFDLETAGAWLLGKGVF